MRTLRRQSRESPLLLSVPPAVRCSLLRLCSAPQCGSKLASSPQFRGGRSRVKQIPFSSDPPLLQEGAGPFSPEERRLPMDRSPKQLQELTLALLYLTSLQDHDDPAGRRCWKGYDFQVLEDLKAQGLLQDTQGRIPPAAASGGRGPGPGCPGHPGDGRPGPRQNNQNRPFRRAQLRRKGRFLPGVQMRPSWFTDRIRCKFSPGPHL